MVCPKCDIGKLQKITLKKSGEKANLCEYCYTLWLEKEEVGKTNSHDGRAYLEENNLEYTFDEMREKEQEPEPIVSVET